jgi:hypothetical protein
VGGSGPEYFGSCVSGGAAVFEEVCLLLEVFGHTHVDDDQPRPIFSFVEHYIFEFEVAVHDTPRVEVGYAVQQLLHEGDHQLSGQRAGSLEQAAEGLFVALHDDVGGVLRFVDALKLAKVFVGALGQHLQLLLEGSLGIGDLVLCPSRLKPKNGMIC